MVVELDEEVFLQEKNTIDKKPMAIKNNLFLFMIFTLKRKRKQSIYLKKLKWFSFIFKCKHKIYFNCIWENIFKINKEIKWNKITSFSLI